MRRTLKWLGRFGRWLFGSPFRDLPPEFGDPVPPELRVFEAEAEEVQHRPRGKAEPLAPGRHPQTKPIRRDESLERE